MFSFCALYFLLLVFFAFCPLRFTVCRQKFLLSRLEGKKYTRERIDIDLFLVQRDTEFSEMFSELTWYTLDKLASLKLGDKHRLKTAKQKREWAESQGWTIVTNKQGVEGVAFSSLDEGVMKMKVGSRFSAEKVRKESHDNSEEHASGYAGRSR
jgi:hypothetical protein